MYRFILGVFLMTALVSRNYGQEDTFFEKNGLYFGLNMGTWFPDGKNKVLGNPTMFGLTIDGKLVHPSMSSFTFNFDLLFGYTTHPIQVKIEDSLQSCSDYDGAHMTIDYCRQFFETRRFLFEAMVGIGNGTIDYYSISKSQNTSISSLIISPGISIRFFISRETVIQLKVQYHIANYDLGDQMSTELTGNYLTTKLILSKK